MTGQQRAHGSGRAPSLDLVGPYDIAKRLGVSRLVVSQWRHRGIMPEPLAVVSGVLPVWEWETIREWWEARQGHGE